MTYIDRIAEHVRSALPPQARPDRHAEELYRLYALLVLVRGEDTTLEDVHDAWSTWMTVHDPSHQSLRPFRQLDTSTRQSDGPYLSAIVAVARDERTYFRP
jgi:hypothetical protein